MRNLCLQLGLLLLAALLVIPSFVMASNTVQAFQIAGTQHLEHLISLCIGTFFASALAMIANIVALVRIYRALRTLLGGKR